MSYTVRSHQGQGLSIPISVRYDLNGLTFSVFVDDNSQFRLARPLGTVTPSDGKLILSFTSQEVDEIKNSYFRIAVYKGNLAFALISGKIEYLPTPASGDDSHLLGSDGLLRIELLPVGVVQESGMDYLVASLVQDDHSSVVSSLNDRYIAKAGYVPGENIDMVVIGSMVDGKIATHVNAANPHPEYDDLPSLRLLFENGLI